MPRLKPITIIALDSYSAAYCESVRQRIVRSDDSAGHLLQMYALVRQADSLGFESHLGTVADTSFDLKSTRSEAEAVSPEEAGKLFMATAVKLESALIAILSGSGDAQTDGLVGAERIDEIRQRTIYLVLSSVDPFASGVFLAMATLIRWLFATKFAEDPYSLESVILLPELFTNVEPLDYACAYALLKKLDYTMTERVEVTPMLKEAPFEFNWLLDSRRSPGDYLGSLGEGLGGYSDALVGFLNAEPEKSGSLITFRMRDKMPAYSTFGYAELYFPWETALTRLSAALAKDILAGAYLTEHESTPDARRQLLLTSKQFVLSSKLSEVIERLADHKPTRFDFQKRLKPGQADEFTAELTAHAVRFKKNVMPEDQKRLESASGAALADLEHELDTEIDRLADASPSGLRQVLEWLDVLTDPKLPLLSYIVSEPENLITQHLMWEAWMDDRLDVKRDNKRTIELLEKADELRSKLNGLHTTLRLMPAAAAHPAEPVAGQTAAPAEPGEPVDEWQKAQTEINDILRELQATESSYEQAFQQERTANLRQRKQKATKAVNEKKKAITEADNQVKEVDKQWRAANIEHAGYQAQLDEVRRRWFIKYPLVALIVCVLPWIGGLLGITPLVPFYEWVTDNPFGVVSGICIAGIVYFLFVIFAVLADLTGKVNKAREQMRSLERDLDRDSKALVGVYADQLKLDFELYKHLRITDVIFDLIEATRRKAEETRHTLENLATTRDWYSRQHSSALPATSRMRRSVLHVSDIDSYYDKEIDSLRDEAVNFTATQVARSQVRRITDADLREKLDAFTRKRFDEIEHLSIGQVLNPKRQMVPKETASERLSELQIASQPLLRLRQIDTNRDKLGQRSETLWVPDEDREVVLELFKKIAYHSTVRAHNDKRSIRLLTRCLYFPAYFLAQIDYFRSCYNRYPMNDTKPLPDLVPLELGVSGETRHALEQILQADALGLIQRRADGNYYFVNNGSIALGPTHRQIAQKFTSDFASRAIYLDLSNAVREKASDQNLVFDRLNALRDLKPELDGIELETLDKLIKKFHPLR